MEREFTMEEGKAGDEVTLDNPDMKFGDKAIRRGFIRKVYMILSVQVTCQGHYNQDELFQLQLSFTVASIIFFTFYIPQQYCTEEEKRTMLEKFSSYFMGTARWLDKDLKPNTIQLNTEYFMFTSREYNSTEEQEKQEQKLMLSLCGM